MQKKLDLIILYFGIRKFATHWVSLGFFCTLVPLSIFTPEAGPSPVLAPAFGSLLPSALPNLPPNSKQSPTSSFVLFSAPAREFFLICLPDRRRAPDEIFMLYVFDPAGLNPPVGLGALTSGRHYHNCDLLTQGEHHILQQGIHMQNVLMLPQSPKIDFCRFVRGFPCSTNASVRASDG